PRSRRHERAERANHEHSEAPGTTCRSPTACVPKGAPVRAARFHAPGDVRLEDVPEPTAGPGDVVIRVRNCSTCGTDVKISRHGHHHIVPPRTMGHEIAGEIMK